MGNPVFFRTKLIQRRFPKPLFPHGIKDLFSQSFFTYCIHFSKALNVKAREPLSRQREPCFLNSEVLKKIHTCPSTNKSTKRHPCVSFYSLLFFPLLQPLLLSEPASTCSMYRKQYEYILLL